MSKFSQQAVSPCDWSGEGYLIEIELTLIVSVVATTPSMVFANGSNIRSFFRMCSGLRRKPLHPLYSNKPKLSCIGKSETKNNQVCRQQACSNDNFLVHRCRQVAFNKIQPKRPTFQQHTQSVFVRA